MPYIFTLLIPKNKAVTLTQIYLEEKDEEQDARLDQIDDQKTQNDRLDALEADKWVW